MDQRQCISCRTRFTPLRNPNQHYCSKSRCQKNRQNRYKREKLKIDTDYKQNQRKAQKQWCSKHSGYWKRYRLCNPEYAASNRLAQRVRNKNRSQKGASEGIAKITPSTPEKVNLSMYYNIVLLTFEMIAKRERYSQAIFDLLALPP